MEYTTPMLQMVGTAQSLVLGVPHILLNEPSVNPTSSAVLEVLGLDD
jgi:hypothetical protein